MVPREPQAILRPVIAATGSMPLSLAAPYAADALAILWQAFDRQKRRGLEFLGKGRRQPHLSACPPAALPLTGPGTRRMRKLAMGATGDSSNAGASVRLPQQLADEASPSSRAVASNPASYRSWSRSLLFRVGALVLVIESLILFAFAAYYVQTYRKEIDNELVASITRPGTMIANGLLSMTAVSTPNAIGSLVSGDVIEAIIVGADGNVFQSSRQSDVGQSVLTVTNFDASWLKQRGSQSFVIHNHDEEPPTIASVTPILSIFAAAPSIFVYVKASTARAESDKRRIAWVAYGSAALAIVMSVGLVSAIVHGLINQRLRRVIRLFRRVGAGDFAARIEGPPGSEEIAALQAGFNDMAQGLDNRTRALRISEERYALAAAGANDGLWDLDLVTGRLYVSDRWKAMMAVPEEGIIGNLEDWLALISPTDSALIRHELNAHLTGAEAAFECEYRLHGAQPESGPRWMHVRGLAFRNAEGQPIRIAGSQTDVTDRREAQEKLARQRDDLEAEVHQRTRELREAERRLITAIDTAPDGLMVVETSGRVAIVNDRVASILPELAGTLTVGASFSTVLSSAAEAFDLPSDWPASQLAIFHSASSYSAELHLPSGRWLQLTASRTPDGSVVARLADVTVYKDASAALQSSLEKEQEVARLHRDFVSMASHQFRTPLAIIDAAAQRMMRIKSTSLLDSIPEHTSIVRTAASKMTALINSLLNSARLDAGDVEFSPRVTSLAPLIQDVCRRQKEISPTIDFVIDIESLPPVVTCDPLLIEQILLNLLSNAAKFSTGQTRVDVIGHKAGAQAVIAVRDYGVGIPREDLERIFQRFNRAQTAKGIAGTGIGLNLAQRLASLHGGTLDVTSEVGAGSCFSLKLPIEPVSGPA